MFRPRPSKATPRRRARTEERKILCSKAEAKATGSVEMDDLERVRRCEKGSMAGKGKRVPGRPRSHVEKCCEKRNNLRGTGKKRGSGGKVFEAPRGKKMGTSVRQERNGKELPKSVGGEEKRKSRAILWKREIPNFKKGGQ